MGLPFFCLALLALVTVGSVKLGGKSGGHELTSRPRESASEVFLGRVVPAFEIIFLGLLVH